MLLRILDQQGHHLTCQILEGSVPTHDDLVQDVYAFELPEMAAPFQEYWAQFWDRDPPEDEHSDDPRQELLQSLRHRIPPTAPLTVRWDDPQIVSQTIHRLKSPTRQLALMVGEPKNYNHYPHWLSTTSHKF